MRAAILLAAAMLMLWMPGAMAATATCTDLVRGSQMAERAAAANADKMAHQKAPASASDRDYTIIKMTNAAIMGRATLAACAAPGEQNSAADVRKWAPGREAAVWKALGQRDNCRPVLYTVQTVMQGALQKSADPARLNYLVAAALRTSEMARKTCPDFLVNIDQFAQIGAVLTARRGAPDTQAGKAPQNFILP